MSLPSHTVKPYIEENSSKKNQAYQLVNNMHPALLHSGLILLAGCNPSLDLSFGIMSSLDYDGASRPGTRHQGWAGNNIKLMTKLIIKRSSRSSGARQQRRHLSINRTKPQQGAAGGRPALICTLFSWAGLGGGGCLLQLHAAVINW